MGKSQFEQLEKSSMPRVVGGREIAAPIGYLGVLFMNEGRGIDVVMIWRLYRYVVEKRAENDKWAV